MIRVKEAEQYFAHESIIFMLFQCNNIACKQ